MNKAQAIHAFWNGFGLTAYDENSIPTGKDAPKLTYITYSFSTDSIDEPVTLYANIWDRSTSWAFVEQKAQEIAEAIVKMNPPALQIDNGRLYIAKGNPFAQRMSDPSDDMVRRVYINISAEFLTAY